MLSRRWLINYFLLVLIIIFTWIGHKYPITEDQKFDRDAITRLKPQQVKSIRIETADGSIQLEKNENRWFITSPFQWFADNIAVERIASLVSTKYHSKLPNNEIDISTLGLSIPKAVVTFNQKPVYFGTTNQIGSRRYLMIDSTVYLVDDIHYAFISNGSSGLIDKRLLPTGSGLKSLQFPDFTLNREASGWVSNKPSQNSDRIQAVIKNWQSLQASSVETYNTGLTPLKKIIAEFDHAQSKEFFLLSIQPEIIIARPDLNLQYHFPEHLYYELLSLDKAPAN
jgi:hypothetical protein